MEHIADPVDRASHEEQIALDAAIRAAREKKVPQLKAIGRCYNCDEELEGDQRFCDGDCRDDYDHRMNRRRLNGTLH